MRKHILCTECPQENYIISDVIIKIEYGKVKGKVNMFLHFGVEVQFHIFLTKALGVAEGSASRRDRFIPRNYRVVSAGYEGGLVPEPVLTLWGKGRLLLKWNPDSKALRPAGSSLYLLSYLGSRITALQ